MRLDHEERRRVPDVIGTERSTIVSQHLVFTQCKGACFSSTAISRGMRLGKEGWWMSDIALRADRASYGGWNLLRLGFAKAVWHLGIIGGVCVVTRQSCDRRAIHQGS